MKKQLWCYGFYVPVNSEYINGYFVIGKAIYNLMLIHIFTI